MDCLAATVLGLSTRGEGFRLGFGGAGIRATVYLGSINSGPWVLITPGTGSEQLRCGPEQVLTV